MKSPLYGPVPLHMPSQRPQQQCRCMLRMSLRFLREDQVRVGSGNSVPAKSHAYRCVLASSRTLCMMYRRLWPNLQRATPS